LMTLGVGVLEQHSSLGAWFRRKIVNQMI
jgi:hypothetical protein